MERSLSFSCGNKGPVDFMRKNALFSTKTSKLNLSFAVLQNTSKISEEVYIYARDELLITTQAPLPKVIMRKRAPQLTFTAWTRTKK